MSYQRWTVTTERLIDGIKIRKQHARLNAAEVHVLKYEEGMLPGILVRFEKRPFEHGDIDKAEG